MNRFFSSHALPNRGQAPVLGICGFAKEELFYRTAAGIKSTLGEFISHRQA